MNMMVRLTTLLFGMALGATGIRFLAPAPVFAQMTSPMPMASAGMMHPASHGQCSSLRSAMMSKMHSPADRSMMNSMMGMHDSMMHAQMTGNADHDFLAMMIPHHEAAVQMAKDELKYGKDPKVRALAQRIISAQQKEIAQMTSWLK